MNAPSPSARSRRASLSLCAMSLWIAASGCGAADSTPADAASDHAAVDARDDVSDALTDAAPDVSDASLDLPDVAPDARGDVPDLDAPPVWYRCHRAFLCADVSVPYDWSRPEGPRATVGVMRIPARRADERVGVLMMNYGGPGAPTIAQVATGYPTVFGTPHDDEIADRFDLVAIDWRGLGRSAPSLACDVVRTHDPLATPQNDVENDAAWAATAAEAMRVQAACAARVPAEFLGRVSSDDAARDMDHVRALLGEETVSYIGYSYGTRLGAAYMALFPTRVRAMVLDSPMGPDLDLRGRARGGGAAFDAAMTAFLGWCAGSESCVFRGPERTAAGVRRRFDALVAALDRTPYTVGKRRASGLDVLAALVTSSFVPARQWRPLGAAFAAARDGDATAILRLSDDALVTDDQFVSGYWAITSLDMPAAADETPDRFRAYLRATLSPYAARTLADSVSTLGWPARRPTPAASLHGLTAPPALIVGSRGDVATPYEWAVALRDAFANGSHLVTYEGAGHAASTQVPCVGNLVADFLFDPASAPAVDTCAAVSP